MFNWFAVQLLPSYHRDDKWMVTIFGTVVPSSEVNEQLTDDLLSLVENQENASARQFLLCW